MGPQKVVANNSLLYSIYVTTYNRPLRRTLVNHLAHKNHPKAVKQASMMKKERVERVWLCLERRGGAYTIFEER